MYKYIHCTTVIIFQKIWYGEARWWQFQMIKGGVKNESEFCLYSFSHSKLCHFLFFSFTKFVVKIKFLSQFSVLANFIENIMKLLFICIQGYGEEEVSISVVYTYIFLLYLFYYSIYKGLIISFSLSRFFGGEGIGECPIRYMRHSLFTSC